MRAIGLLYCFNEILDFGGFWIIFHHRLFAFHRDNRFFDAFHIFQCRLHCSGARASRHAGNFECYRLLFCRRAGRKQKRGNRQAPNCTNISALHIIFLSRKFYHRR